MTELHTSEALLAALLHGSVRSPSSEQIEAQRLSFVMGVLPDSNQMTREEVKSILDKQEGRSLGA